MPFDPTTAQPVEEFDPSTAQPSPAAEGQDMGATDAMRTSLLNTVTLGKNLPAAAAAGVATGVDRLLGKDTQYSDVYGKMTANDAATEEANPGAAAAGTGVGLGMGGGAINAGLKAASAASKIVRGITTLREGETAKNALKLAVLGGGVGGATSAVESDGDLLQTGLGIGLGAIVGPLAKPAISGLAWAGRRIAGHTGSAGGVSREAWAFVARAIDRPAKQLIAAEDAYFQATGRHPHLPMILEAAERADLAYTVGRTSKGSAAMIAAEDAASAGRLKTAPEKIAANAPKNKFGGDKVYVSGIMVDNITTEAAIVAARDAQMTAQMKSIGKIPVTVGPDEAAILDDPRLRKIVIKDLGAPATATTPRQPGLADKFQEFDNAIIRDDNGNAVGGAYYRFTADDFEQMRHSLRAKQGVLLAKGEPREAQYVGQLAASVSKEIAAVRVPIYGKVLGAYEDQTQFLVGFKHSAGGKTLGDAATSPLITDLESKHGQAGITVGARTRLAEMLGKSEAGAVSTSEALRQNGKLMRDMTEALGPKEAAAAQRLGKAESEGARAMAEITPEHVVAPSEERAGMGRAALEATAVVSYGHMTTGYKLGLVERLWKNFKLSSGAAKFMAEKIATNDPKQIQEVVDALRRRGASNHKLRKFAYEMSIPFAYVGGRVPAALTGKQGAQ